MGVWLTPDIEEGVDQIEGKNSLFDADTKNFVEKLLSAHGAHNDVDKSNGIMTLEAVE